MRCFQRAQAINCRFPVQRGFRAAAVSWRHEHHGSISRHGAGHRCQCRHRRSHHPASGGRRLAGDCRRPAPGQIASPGRPTRRCRAALGAGRQRPRRRGRAAPHAATAAWSLTSSANGSTAAPSWSARACNLSRRRAAAITRQPSATRRRVMASPMPTLAPVTSAVPRDRSVVFMSPRYRSRTKAPLNREPAVDRLRSLETPHEGWPSWSRSPSPFGWERYAPDRAAPAHAASVAPPPGHEHEHEHEHEHKHEPALEALAFASHRGPRVFSLTGSVESQRSGAVSSRRSRSSCCSRRWHAAGHEPRRSPCRHSYSLRGAILACRSSRPSRPPAARCRS